MRQPFLGLGQHPRAGSLRRRLPPLALRLTRIRCTLSAQQQAQGVPQHLGQHALRLQPAVGPARRRPREFGPPSRSGPNRRAYSCPSRSTRRLTCRHSALRLRQLKQPCASVSWPAHDATARIHVHPSIEYPSHKMSGPGLTPNSLPPSLSLFPSLSFSAHQVRTACSIMKRAYSC